MKKSFVALAVLGAFAGTSMAADVTMYGIVDTGLLYQHGEVSATIGSSSGSAEVDSFSMETGTNSASRFGIRGTEDLGNGMTVGFKLENGFESDTGALKTDSKLFDRESTLFVKGGFGTVYAGRMGTLVSDAGSVGFYGSMASALGTGWSDNIAGHNAVMANYESRYDNTIAYVSPEFAGVTFYAQYAMGDGEENKSSTDRYAALGAEWRAGALDLGFVVDYLNKDSVLVSKNDPNVQDTWTFNLAGSYDFGFMKTYLATQYFKDARDAGSVVSGIGLFDLDFWEDIYNGDPTKDPERAQAFAKAAVAQTGYGVHLSTALDVLGGTMKAGIGYMDADIDYAHDGQVGDSKVYTAALGYEYSLSKRTLVYTGLGYTKRELDANYNGVIGNWEEEGYDFALGLVHKF